MLFMPRAPTQGFVWRARGEKRPPTSLTINISSTRLKLENSAKRRDFKGGVLSEHPRVHQWLTPSRDWSAWGYDYHRVSEFSGGSTAWPQFHIELLFIDFRIEPTIRS